MKQALVLALILILTVFLIPFMTPQSGAAQEIEMKKKIFQIPENFIKLQSQANFKELSWVSSKQYAFAPSDQARDFDKNIDIDSENKKVSQWLSYLKEKAPNIKREMVLVPGFVPEDGRPVRLHEFAKIRIEKAMEEFNKGTYPAIMLSGGNVHPPETPYNEALEMKKYLMSEYKVPEHMIAIEPYAKNTVTNLRNVGRFMIKHHIKRVVLFSNNQHNLYIGHPWISSFHFRSMFMLGYRVGWMELLGHYKSAYHPYDKVFTKGKDPKDP